MNANTREERDGEEDEEDILPDEEQSRCSKICGIKIFSCCTKVESLLTIKVYCFKLDFDVVTPSKSIFIRTFFIHPEVDL